MKKYPAQKDISRKLLMKITNSTHVEMQHERTWKMLFEIRVSLKYQRVSWNWLLFSDVVIFHESCFSILTKQFFRTFRRFPGWNFPWFSSRRFGWKLVERLSGVFFPYTLEREDVFFMETWLVSLWELTLTNGSVSYSSIHEHGQA